MAVTLVTASHALYLDQAKAFVSNIGALVQPLTKYEYKSGTKSTCVGLFSHSDFRMPMRWGRRMLCFTRHLRQGAEHLHSNSQTPPLLISYDSGEKAGRKKHYLRIIEL